MNATYFTLNRIETELLKVLIVFELSAAVTGAHFLHATVDKLVLE